METQGTARTASVLNSDSAWSEKHRMRRGYDGQQNAIMYCRECKGVGKSLTKHCVGRMLTDAEEEQIAAGRLNFVNGQWERK